MRPGPWPRVRGRYGRSETIYLAGDSDGSAILGAGRQPYFRTGPAGAAEMSASTAVTKVSAHSLHVLGVACGLAAGAWLGAAEAPTKLVTAGLSPFLVSLGMVLGVFVGRWTVPMALKGTGYIWADLRAKPHLMVWAILAGMLWAVANTLTVFAIRNVGLSTAFPLWNTNSLVGLFWGWLLFHELRGASGKERAKVLGGAGAIVTGAALVAYATASRSSTADA